MKQQLNGFEDKSRARLNLIFCDQRNSNKVNNKRYKIFKSETAMSTKI